MKHACIWISAATAVAVVVMMIAISCGKHPEPGPGPGPNPLTDYMVTGKYGTKIEGKLKPAAKANVDEAKRFMQTGADMVD